MDHRDERDLVDHAFLDTVEAGISQALQGVAELEAGLDRLAFEPSNAWQNAFANMSVNLTNWQERLGELTRQTAAVEADLAEQETALRGWMQAAGFTSHQLAEAAKPR